MKKSLSEIFRVLKPGGKFGFTDNITVEDWEGAEYYNRYERLRDPSHRRVCSKTDLQNVLRNAGFEIGETVQLEKEFEFHHWADRQRVSPENQEKLQEMMRQIPASWTPLFRPRWVSNTMYFRLWEIVVSSRRPRL